MKIALIGVTGNVGSRILAEALRRGHAVTGIARNPEKSKSQPGLVLQRGDVNDPAQLKAILVGHDAVISATRFEGLNVRSLIATIKDAKVKRLLMVGGAGSLEVSPGVQLINTPGFPAAYKAEAGAGVEALAVLRSEKDLNWTFLSPSAEFVPGQRTGKFRLGGNRLLTLPDGGSKISMEDFAIAMIDELEHPHHPYRRFTVGY